MEEGSISLQPVIFIVQRSIFTSFSTKITWLLKRTGAVPECFNPCSLYQASPRLTVIFREGVRDIVTVD